MKQIKANALFRIKEGKLDEFKQLIHEFISAVKGKEPGNLYYDWYLNEERRECIVLEAYADSNAVLAHAANVGHLLQKTAEISDLSLEVYGKPSEELLMAIKGMNIKIYPFFAGI